jgi:N-acetylglucosamine-6-sulfatase
MKSQTLTRRDFLRLSLFAAGGITLAGCDMKFLKGDERPNFVVILTDDQRYDTMQYMPRTKARIFDKGVTFNHGYATTPLCGPSRRSILTGMYAHNHGTLDNANEDFTEKTFIDYLQEDGYYTGLVGKYANTWKGEPRPEFDYWVSFSKGESRYNNPRLNVNGEWIRFQDRYITDVFGEQALEFIENASRKNSPFCLFFAPNAPHEPAVSANEDKFTDLDLPERTPNFNEQDVSDKPNWLSKDPMLTDEDIASLDEFRRNQILTLFSLDRVIDSLITRLEDKGLLDNTVVIFLSDNGKLWGEHRRNTKNSAYEEATRIPFAIRYPPLTSAAQVEERAVANIDIAPTLYELAGIPIPEKVDGESLSGLLRSDGNENWRQGILIEGWPARGVYAAYHTGDYVYVETVGDKPEFYDLKKDPYQLENAAELAEYQSVIEQMRKKLTELRSQDTQPQEFTGEDDE